MTYGGFKRMTTFCKTRVPDHITSTLESIKDNDEAVKVLPGNVVNLANRPRCILLSIALSFSH